MKAIGIITTTIFLMAFSIIVNGYTLSVLLGWFIVPQFGLADLSIPTAIGFAMVVGYLTDDIDTKKSEHKEWSVIIFTGTIIAI